MESLYGGVKHENRNENMGYLLDGITSSIKANSKVIIPVFALHRAQEILEFLRVCYQRNLIKDSTKVFLDSPMAIEITNIYNNFNNSLNTHYNILGKDVNYSNGDVLGSGFDLNSNRFDFAQLQNVRKSKKSQKLISKNGVIILAGSGMADGGRVVRHIFNNIEDSHCTIVFVGYQAEGTLGRQLVDGVSSVVINEEKLTVRAKIL
jgi:metallo-beta-lactamase family protein